MALAAALASKKVPLFNLFHLKSKIYVPEQKKEMHNDSFVSSEVFCK